MTCAGSIIREGLPLRLDGQCAGDKAGMGCAAEATFEFEPPGMASQPPEHWRQPTAYVADSCVEAETEFQCPEKRDTLGMSANMCFSACAKKRGMRYFGVANGD